MRSNFLLLLLCFITIITYGQNERVTTLNLGDSSPAIHIKEWLKGKPVEQFEKGKMYVVEFWATWCKPCIAEIPRLSKLARKYRKKATIIGVDVYEKKTTSINKIRTFVDSMGHRMKYQVAIEDSDFMETAWLKASGESGIPSAFVINAEGRLAWFGYSAQLHEVLPAIINNNWNIKETLAQRELDRHLEELDYSFNYDLLAYNGKPVNWYGDPDSAILIIDKIITNEPKLKYAPIMAFNTFVALLKTNQHKAYEYGKEAIISNSYNETVFNKIIYAIEWYSDKTTLSKEIYELGAETYQSKIDHIPYPEIIDMYSYYNKMAEWYWRAGNKSKALYAQKKAISALKKK